MKYLKQTFAYLFLIERGKRVLLLYLLSIPVGISFAMMFPSYPFLQWVLRADAEASGFWSNFTYGINGYVYWIGAGALLLTFVVFVALASTVVSRSMRMGKFRIVSVLADINDGFFPAAYMALTVIAAVTLLKTASSLVVGLWFRLSNPVLVSILNGACTVAIGVVAMYLATVLVAYFPLMIVNGLKPYSAFINSVRKCVRHKKHLFVGIFLPVATVTVGGILVSLAANPLASVLFDSFTYAFLVAYFIPFVLIAYYEIEGIGREDFTREYFFRKSK